MPLAIDMIRTFYKSENLETMLEHLFVGDNNGIRKLSLREGLRLFGYPDDFKFNVSLQDGYDLLGNTVVVPVIKQVALRVLKICATETKNENECA